MASMNADDITISNMARSTNLRLALVTETFPPEINGVAMTLGQLVDGLLARGHQVQLVRPRQSSETGSASAKGYEEALATGVPIPRYDGLRFGLPARARLLKLWKTQRPDLVHVATEGPLGWSAVAAAKVLKIPVTSGFHTNFDSYSGHYGIGWLKRPVANYLRKFHNRTLATLVPTRAMAQNLEQQGYLNLQVLARGVDSELFHPRHRSLELRKAWGVEPDGFAVIYVGRLAPEKNLALVEEAFAAIRRLRPEARLILIGDGPERRSLEARNPDFHFCGMRTGYELAAHYASGDMFLFASQTETFGNVVLEAMASGLPVVAYDYAAAAELIQDGLNGISVSLGDREAYIAAACAASIKPQVLQAFGKAARQQAERNDWRQIHESLEQILLRVLRHHQRQNNRKDQLIQLLPA